MNIYYVKKIPIKKLLLALFLILSFFSRSFLYDVIFKKAMDKNFDNLSLVLGILGLIVAIGLLVAALLSLPEFLSYLTLPISGANIAGIVLGALSLKTSENRWKPILAIILGVIALIISEITTFITIIPLMQELMNLYRYLQ